jgi:hypothetical protein
LLGKAKVQREEVRIDDNIVTEELLDYFDDFVIISFCQPFKG